ncbi:unnamed protein product, partial [Gongylonema pulchrum]|uniref:Catalase n=1 Tax=Gongylonema pulchrum TaxID=637853 RepID=A0A183EHL0_9BILA
VEHADCKESAFAVTGDVDRYDSGDEDNFTQPRELWLKVLGDSGRAELVENLATELHHCKPIIQERAISLFSNVHSDFGKALRKELDVIRQKTGHAFKSEGPGLLSCRSTESSGMPHLETEEKIQVLGDSGRAELVENLATELHHCKPIIQERAISLFSNVHSDFGKALRKELDVIRQKTGHAFKSEGPGLLSCRSTESSGMPHLETGSPGKCM